MREGFNVLRLGEDGTLNFDTVSCKPKLEVTYGNCSEERGRIYKGCRVTNVIEPTYTILERFIRWVGRKLNIGFLLYFCEKSTLYEYSFESVEEWAGA